MPDTSRDPGFDPGALTQGLARALADESAPGRAMDAAGRPLGRVGGRLGLSSMSIRVAGVLLALYATVLLTVWSHDPIDLPKLVAGVVLAAVAVLLVAQGWRWRRLGIAAALAGIGYLIVAYPLVLTPSPHPPTSMSVPLRLVVLFVDLGALAMLFTAREPELPPVE